MHYRIYNLLRKHDIRKIGEEWNVSKIPKESGEIIRAPGIPIMQNNWS